MKAIIQSVIIRSLALLLSVSVAFAQDRPAFKQEELDQMLAPIALYPDSMLSQILMASTYPLEVVQAARWSRSNAHLKGQDAVRAVEPMDWDPSVKSLVAFPQILHRMDERLDWTQRLGEAFLAQEPQVMETIQGLRQRAAAAGNLRSNDQIRVARQDERIIIEPAHPQVVYVPYYDPVDAYGPWWWPAYPPVFWGPPPGYYVAPVHAPAFIWGSGIVIGTGFFFGHFNWPHRHVIVVHHHPAKVVVHRPGTVVHRALITPDHKPVRWQHNPHHRRGVPFRNAAARERFEQSRAAADARRDPDRNGAAKTARRADDDRSADIRQRRMEERREAVQERREDGRKERHESAVNRVAPNNDSNRTAANRIDKRISPAVPEARTAQPESRNAQPEARSVQREKRSAQDRDARPERSAPQANDRRGERRDVQRLQARSADPQPTVVAPVVRFEARSAVAAPVVRAEPRPNPRPAAPAVNTHANPRQVFEGGRRAEARNDGDRGRQHNTVRESASAPRPFASSGSATGRVADGNHRSGGGAFRQQSRRTAVR